MDTHHQRWRNFMVGDRHNRGRNRYVEDLGVNLWVLGLSFIFILQAPRITQRVAIMHMTALVIATRGMLPHAAVFSSHPISMITILGLATFPI